LLHVKMDTLTTNSNNFQNIFDVQIEKGLRANYKITTLK
jgi:hypothetical protein